MSSRVADVTAWDSVVGPYRVLIFVGVQGILAVSNALLTRRLSAFPPARERPRVSVLVPARNEATCVGACAESLLAQDYENFELVFLDDGSTDGTGAILAAFEDRGLRVIDGKPLPDGWSGKSWACRQLADAATGGLLFFTDADTVHAPATLTRAVNACEATRSDLLTAITGNEVRTLGERLTVPFLAYSIGTLLPLAAAYALGRAGSLSAANGKFLLFRREAYDRVGGHGAVRDHATEDLALCRLIKSRGFRWRLVDASDDVSARMYRGLRDAVDGFTKNFFALFDYRILPALFVWFWMALITWHPIVATIAGLVLRRHDGRLLASAATAVLAGLLWLLVAIKYRMPRVLAFLYPLTISVCVFIGLRSMTMTVLGKTTWKDRTLVRRRARLI